MIQVQTFIQGAIDNTDRIHKYQLGHDGSDGTSDCIGLIVGALELCGFDWPGVHGSNWAARNVMSTLGYISSSKECFLGEVVYKAREPGDAKYDLPSSYKNSPDQKDYYHVGVVTCLNPFTITHCTGVEGGIKYDYSLGAWHYGGKLKYVNYDDEEELPMESYNAQVLSEDRNPVKMRKIPSANSKILVKVPYGAIVKVVGTVDGTWSAIEYLGQPGYMMSKFLFPIDKNEAASSDQDKLEELCELLAKANEILYDLMNKEGDTHAD